MFGTKALELIKEFQSSKTGALQSYNVSLFTIKGLDGVYNALIELID